MNKPGDLACGQWTPLKPRALHYQLKETPPGRSTAYRHPSNHSTSGRLLPRHEPCNNGAGGSGGGPRGPSSEVRGAREGVYPCTSG